jgi:hypothetical protein
MSSRLTRDDFKTLVADRADKGLNVIQFAAADPCDIAPFDDRGGKRYNCRRSRWSTVGPSPATAALSCSCWMVPWSQARGSQPEEVTPWRRM